MESIQGYKFNNINPSTKFYTIINDINDNSPTIYFSKLENLHKLPNYYTSPLIISYENLHHVNIFDNSIIFIESDIYKTDKYKLSDKILLSDYNIILNLIRNSDINNPYIIKFINFEEIYTYDLCLYACKNDGFVLYYISKEQKEKNIFSCLQYSMLCIEACKQNGLALRFALYQFDNLCKIACCENGYALKYVIKQTKDICMDACKQNGLALIYVDDQTYDICITACESNGLSLRCVFLPNSRLNIIACMQNGMALQHVRIKTKEICDIAIKQNYKARQFIK